MTILRPAEFSDSSAICAVHERNGLGTFEFNAWRRKWVDYPHANLFSETPIGWVIESSEQGVVGTIGNLPMLYELEGEPIRAAIAFAWGVDSEYRPQALKLLEASRKQPEVDLWLDTSANPTASKILTALKAPRIPIPEYAHPAFFPVNRRSFAKAALRRRGARLASLVALPTALAMLGRDAYLRGISLRSSQRVELLNGFDDRFDKFWDRIRSGPPRLRAVRGRAVLTWRFASFLSDGNLEVLGVFDEDGIRGYAVLARREEEDSGLQFYDVADLQVVGDDPSTIRDLLIGAMEVAALRGSHVVKWLCGNPQKREPAARIYPYTYCVGHWPLYYRGAKPGLEERLQDAGTWDIGYFETY